MTGLAPVTGIQRQLWLADRLAPPAAYTVGMSWALRGDLDREALRRAAGELWRRHPALRTSVREVDGELRQVIADPEDAAQIPEVEFAEVQDSAAMARARNAWGSLALDLEAGPVARVRVVRRSDPGSGGGSELQLAIHHALCDEASLAIWIRDLFTLYGAAVAGAELAGVALPEQGSSLADLAARQQQPAHRAAVDEALDFWSDELAGAPQVTDLPRRMATAGDAAGSGGNGESVGHLLEPLPDSVTEAIATLRRQGFTSFQAVAAGLGLTLGRYSGQEDVVIGTPVSGRLDPGVADVMGMFASTTVLRLRPDLDASAGRYLGATRDAALDAMDFAAASLEEVVDRVRPERTGRSPLFQVMLAYNTEAGASGSGELNATPVYIPPALARFELTVFAIERADGSLVIRADYQRDQLDDALVTSLVRDIGRGIELLAGPPERTLGQLPWSDAEQVRALTTGTARCEPGYLTGPDLLRRIREVAARRAEHVAVIDPDGTGHTYRQLLEHADRITARLGAAGVGSGDVVAVPRADGAASIAAMIGGWAAGAVWAPLDPRAPQARVRRLVELSGARAVLTAHDEVELTGVGGSAEETTEQPEQPEQPEQRGSQGSRAAGYLYFTSGSSGEPKPVLVGLPALQNLTLGFIDRHRFTEADVLLALPPLTFDAALGDVVPMLTVGGTVVLHPDPAALSGPDLGTFCRAHAVTVVDAPSALWQQWCVDLDGATGGPSDLPGSPAGWPTSVRAMMVGGEAVPRTHVEMWQRATGGRVPLFNHYGPTEAAVCATVHEVGGTIEAAEVSDQGLSIGRSLPNVACYLLDRVGRPVPEGVVGEMVIGGAGVAHGYLGADLAGPTPVAALAVAPDGADSERADSFGSGPFVADPFGADLLPGSRGVMYRTGDFAVRGSTGLLHFLGRRDLQVKILGRRIELGEIEAAIAAHPEVASCAVTAPADAAGRRRLVAHLAPRSAPPSTSPAQLQDSGLGQRVRAYLADRLPHHLVPVAYLVSARLPLTDRGKVDRAALPEPDTAELRAVEYLPPRTPTQEFLAAVWSEELGGVEVGRADTFAEVGGTSLAAARVSGRIHAAHGVRIGLRDLLGEATLEAIAAEIDTSDSGADAGASLSTAAAADAEEQARTDLRLLDRALASVSEPPPRDAAPATAGPRLLEGSRRILLTGATGFLGAHLLHSLIEHGAAEVHTLARGTDRADAARRVAEQTRRMRLPDLPEQVGFGVGDLAAATGEPGGVDWAALLERFDTVVNVGGLVRVESDYAGHRGPNVLGPARLLDEAARTGRQVHHVSTLGVFWSSRYATARVSELDSPAAGFPFGGYNQSKWVSDLLAVTAAAAGLPVTVHRPARLTTAWRTGAAPSGTWWSGMLSACRELRLVPDLAFREDLLPVDWVADGMARLILSGERAPVLHYWSGDTLTYAGIAQVLAERDPEVRVVDYATWHQALMGQVSAGGAPLFAPFVANLAKPGAARRQVPDFDASASLDLLRGVGAEPLPSAADLLRREIDTLDAGAVPAGGQR